MRLAVTAVAMLTVRTMAAPHSAGSASYNRQRTACLRAERVVDALSEAILLSKNFKARNETSNEEGEAASTTKTSSISEKAGMMAISRRGDNPEEFIKRLNVEAGLGPRAENTESMSKRKPAPRPWCFRRMWFCRKRDLLRLDPATDADANWRETDSQSCWHPWNLLWEARHMVDALLRMEAPRPWAIMRQSAAAPWTCTGTPCSRSGEEYSPRLNRLGL